MRGGVYTAAVCCCDDAALLQAIIQHIKSKSNERQNMFSKTSVSLVGSFKWLIFCLSDGFRSRRALYNLPRRVSGGRRAFKVRHYRNTHAQRTLALGIHRCARFSQMRMHATGGIIQDQRRLQFHLQAQRAAARSWRVCCQCRQSRARCRSQRPAAWYSSHYIYARTSTAAESSRDRRIWRRGASGWEECRRMPGSRPSILFRDRRGQ